MAYTRKKLNFEENTLRRFQIGVPTRVHKKQLLPLGVWGCSPERKLFIRQLVAELVMPSDWPPFGDDLVGVKDVSVYTSDHCSIILFCTVRIDLCMSCLCPVYVLFMSCLCPVYVLFMSCLCPVYVLFMSCLCPVYMSCLCPVYVLFMSCLCPVYVLFMS
jgi:hypothetical protein